MMKHKLHIFVALIIISLTNSGCIAVPMLAEAAATGTVLNGTASGALTKPSTGSRVDPEADQSALEKRSIQLKEIDAKYKLTFRAVMDVLQDMGFTIEVTNFETGHIIGIKKIPITTTTTNFLLGKNKTKTYIPQESTVTMEEWSKHVTRVRVNTDLGKTDGGSINLNSVDKARYLEPDKFYEEFFANLSKAIFLRKEKI